MKAKYTNGPWKFRDSASGTYYYIETVDQSHKNTFIGEVGGGLQSNPEIEANAKLIAAAPEMLEALNLMIEMYEELMPIGDLEPFLEIGKQAIKKATE